ncbi:MAG: response regulator [Deltaproteobacteria bacterium]|nr:response regulator [Deltaproteobacteria bacterium]
MTKESQKYLKRPGKVQTGSHSKHRQRIPKYSPKIREYFNDFLDKATAQLKYRDRLLQSLAISANYLLGAHDFKYSITAAIQTLCESLAVDRAQVFEKHVCTEADHGLFSLRFGWINNGTETQGNSSSNCDLPHEFISSGWFEILSKGHPIKGSVKDFPQFEHEFLKAQGVVSALIVPIQVDCEFWGFLEFDDCRKRREWNSTELSIVFAAVANIGVAIGRKKYQEALKANEERYRLLVDNAPIGIISTDNKGNVTDVNTKLVEIVGSPSAEDTKSINLYNFQPLIDAGISDAVRKCCEEGAEVSIEVPYTSKWGKNTVLRTLCTPIRNNQGETLGCQSLMEDVTHEVELQRQLSQAQRLEAMGLVAGGVAHDFNNLLQVIVGYSDLLLSRRTENDKEFSELKKISCAAKSGAELVKGLLTFGGRIEAKPKPLDINQVVRQFGKLISRAIPKMISIQMILDTNLENVLADPIQIQQILMNLSMNAKDAMAEGGELTFQTKNVILDQHFYASHVDLRPGSYVSLTVSDTGAGMSKEVLDRIFEPFFTTKPVEQGSGLGLSIAYEIIKQHSGRITCQSQTGEGTIFEVLLPSIEAKEQIVQDSLSGTIGPSGVETILFADDEPAIRELAGTYLTESGYKILMTSDGLEALSVFQRKSAEIDLVIVDLLMPEIGGLQLINEIRKHNPGIKIIVTTGQFVDEPTTKIIQSQIQFFLSKPYDMVRFLEIVRDVLDQKQT